MKKERTKGFVAGLLVAVMAVGLIGTAAATIGKRTAELDYADIKIELNGEKVTPVDANGNTVEPFAINGTTYLPVRAVSDALGLDVAWDGATSTVKLTGKSDFRGVYVQTLTVMDAYKTLEDMVEYGQLLADILTEDVNEIFSQYADLASVREEIMEYTSDDLPTYKTIIDNHVKTVDSLLAESKTGYLKDCLNSMKANCEKLQEGYDDLAMAYICGYLFMGDPTDENWNTYSTYRNDAYDCFLSLQVQTSSKYNELRDTLKEMLENA